MRNQAKPYNTHSSSHTFNPMSIFSNFLIVGLIFLSVFALTLRDAQASRPRVSCEFSWKENQELNVKAGNKFRNATVRTSEYNRLIAMGSVPARVSADRGQHCQLNHPENTLIDTQIEKADFRLHHSGRIPNCSDLNAVVVCRGADWRRNPTLYWLESPLLTHNAPETSGSWEWWSHSESAPTLNQQITAGLSWRWNKRWGWKYCFAGHTSNHPHDCASSTSPHLGVDIITPGKPIQALLAILACPMHRRCRGGAPV